MTTLLLHLPDCNAGPSAETVFGGQPSAPQGWVQWPACRTCKGAMQFLGQIRSASDELLLLFMCQNDPGLCEEWDADGGGNQVIAVGTSELQLLQPPADGETLRQTRHGASLLTVDAADYDQARSQWMESSAKPGREVLGQLGGEPSWLQNDETPQCDSCRQPMEFVAQLEQGPDWKTEMNFGGGGCAYIFRCSCAGGSAKLLWQC